MDKMKDYKYCNQLFDMALDNGIVKEQDRERFMESELFDVLREANSLNTLCIWFKSGFAGEVLAKLGSKGIYGIDPSYQRKTTADRIKEAFDEWMKAEFTKEEREFGEQFKKHSNGSITFYAGAMWALKDAGTK